MSNSSTFQLVMKEWINFGYVKRKRDIKSFYILFFGGHGGVTHPNSPTYKNCIQNNPKHKVSSFALISRII